MRILIASNFLESEKYRKAFRKLEKEFRKTKECQKLEKNGCKKLIMDFTKGQMITFYPNGKSIITKGLVKEKSGEVMKKVEKEKGKICCICKERYFGFGNNAEPLKSGRCCNKCNDLVIADRINRAFKIT